MRGSASKPFATSFMNSLSIAPNVSTTGDGTPAALRAHNRGRVLQVLLERIDVGATQAELSSETGLSRPSIGSILKTFEQILHAPEVAEATTAPSSRRRGRLGASYRLDPAAAWFASIDVGRKHVYVGVADLRGAGGEIRHRVEPNPAFEIRRSPLLTLELAADTLNQLLDETPELQLDGLAGLVLSLPGPVASDRPRGGVLEWGEYDIGQGIWEALRSSSPRWRGHPEPEVIVDNDANLYAVAEHTWGAGVGGQHIFYVKWSTGLGGGLILDGELRRGAGGGAGEFGHTPVPAEAQEGVEKCPVCHGQCFESAIGFRQLLEERNWGYREVQKIARDPDHPEYSALEAWIGPRADLLGLALVPVVNTVNPELVIIDGILDRDMESLFARKILVSLERNGAMASNRSDLKVRGGNFTDSAAARGGLALAIQELAPRFLLERTGGS